MSRTFLLNIVAFVKFPLLPPGSPGAPGLDKPSNVSWRPSRDSRWRCAQNLACASKTLATFRMRSKWPRSTRTELVKGRALGFVKPKQPAFRNQRQIQRIRNRRVDIQWLGINGVAWNRFAQLQLFLHRRIAVVLRASCAVEAYSRGSTRCRGNCPRAWVVWQKSGRSLYTISIRALLARISIRGLLARSLQTQQAPYKRSLGEISV